MAARKHLPGGAPAMWGRAEQQVGNGAQHLFARLGTPGDQATAGISALERVMARLRAGEWSEPLAALVSQALALDRTSGPASGRDQVTDGSCT